MPKKELFMYMNALFALKLSLQTKNNGPDLTTGGPAGRSAADLPGFVRALSAVHVDYNDFSG